MAFPRKIVGRCPVCGGNGVDDPSPPSGFSTSSLDTEGSGYELVTYKGQLMCQLCKKRLTADDESLKMAEGHRKNDEFLARAGFKRKMED